MGRVVYPNQIDSATVQIFGSGGAEITGVLSNASLQIGTETPIAATINGMVLSATIPNNHALGEFTFTWTWTQTANLYGTGPVTSTEQAAYPVTIIAQPSGSSQSYAPANVSRQCVRLVEPADTTVEQIVDGSLAIYANIPYTVLRGYVTNFPSFGPDTVNFSYVDTSGQPDNYVFNCTLWMSDNAYIFVSADQGTQFGIASIRADFWQANAVAINTRNSEASAVPLMPCSNSSRYDWPPFLPNQEYPSLLIVDGVVINPGTTQNPNVI